MILIGQIIKEKLPDGPEQRSTVTLGILTLFHCRSGLRGGPLAESVGPFERDTRVRML